MFEHLSRMGKRCCYIELLRMRTQIWADTDVGMGPGHQWGHGRHTGRDTTRGAGTHLRGLGRDTAHRSGHHGGRRRDQAGTLMGPQLGHGSHGHETGRDTGDRVTNGATPGTPTRPRPGHRGHGKTPAGTPPGLKPSHQQGHRRGHEWGHGRDTSGTHTRPQGHGPGHELGQRTGG